MKSINEIKQQVFEGFLIKKFYKVEMKLIVLFYATNDAEMRKKILSVLSEVNPNEDFSTDIARRARYEALKKFCKKQKDS